ncbi:MULTISPECIES: TerC family protein [Sphingobacterium]|uniref:TerC family protein n=1 Tax=Sphingobacterium kitahiroshimense TaxID=470446 RepID=A0ABV0BR64_9SPHI|nr:MULTISPECIES: TerC family protein [Sphingobacterium]MBB2951911.1 putative tellurium resistance membrane protein TerC [Sphingobacterium sp. JUb56]MCS3554004.1 putative tellurium resistance membrane protein TerC [Sphingobacterium sp. JUb21]MCW2260443.1 putative tellurium resistance membrane protein TerC [Sphingobacterium kitahiroshimense]TCR05323.1 putative tellurium resistance membrane protein TerC [Sphingobacterium sp. JUb20]TCR05515.1 putative tellurium resistance membrane protein TerC [Sp
MEWISDPQIWISLLTLTVLEVVLGIDNIVFISILSGKLPAEQQKKARQLGLMLALVTRVLLLFSIKWIMSLTEPFINLATTFGINNPDWSRYLELSGRDLILFIGGLFLIYKSTTEIHHKMDGHTEEHTVNKKGVTFLSTIFQILILDIVFSLDSVITAVGMVDQIGVMVAAVIIAVVIMLLSSEQISKFVNNYPSVKMLALSFLLLIGVSLTAEAFDQHIPKGYIYFAMAFSVLVEFLNIKSEKKQMHKQHDK